MSKRVKAVHMHRYGAGNGGALCGAKRNVGALAVESLQLTHAWGEVTCRSCLYHRPKGWRDAVKELEA